MSKGVCRNQSYFLKIFFIFGYKGEGSIMATPPARKQPHLFQSPEGGSEKVNKLPVTSQYDRRRLIKQRSSSTREDDSPLFNSWLSSEIERNTAMKELMKCQIDKIEIKKALMMSQIELIELQKQKLMIKLNLGTQC